MYAEDDGTFQKAKKQELTKLTFGCDDLGGIKHWIKHQKDEKTIF